MNYVKEKFWRYVASKLHFLMMTHAQPFLYCGLIIIIMAGMAVV